MLQHALLGVLLRSDVKGGRRTRARAEIACGALSGVWGWLTRRDAHGALTGCGLCHPCVGLACWCLVVYV